MTSDNCEIVYLPTISNQFTDFLLFSDKNSVLSTSFTKVEGIILPPTHTLDTPLQMSKNFVDITNSLALGKNRDC